MTDKYTVDRRTVLQGTAAVVLGTGLAGCSGDDGPSDPNTYDFKFVEADDLARNPLRYKNQDITTQTPVHWTDTYLEQNDGSKLYTAHPDDTERTFDVIDEVNDPDIESVLGETLDDSTHHDIPLQLYGHIERIWSEPLNQDIEHEQREYYNAVFVVEDAERANKPTGTTTPGNNTTSAENSTAYEG